MTINSSHIGEAKKYLDQLHSDLLVEFKDAKSGEEVLDQMEQEIRKYDPQLQQAIKLALRTWLEGNDENKFGCALELIHRLEIVDYLPDLEKLLEQLREGRVRWSPLVWMDYVKIVSDELRKARKKD